MALKKTVEEMKDVLLEMSFNLEKAVRGNKAAAQRVRKQTIEFAKIAKVFRKESVAEGKKGKKKAKKTTRKKTASRKKTTTRKKATKKKATTRRKKTARRR